MVVAASLGVGVCVGKNGIHVLGVLQCVQGVHQPSVSVFLSLSIYVMLAAKAADRQGCQQQIDKSNSNGVKQLPTSSPVILVLGGLLHKVKQHRRWWWWVKCVDRDGGEEGRR